jgi:hypothetical protein
VLTDPATAKEILDHYRTSAIVPMSVLGAARAAVERKPSASSAYDERVFEKQDKTKPKRTVVTSVSAGEAGRMYKSFAVCGALWYSGLLSTVLSVLGWTQVDAKIRQIAAGRLADMKDKKKIAMNLGTPKDPKDSLRTRAINLAKKSDRWTLPTRRKTSFGAGRTIDPDARANFLEDQFYRCNAREIITDATANSAAFTPQFLEIYLHEVTETGGKKPEMQKQTSDVAQFRLVSYASACVLYVITKHVKTCFPETPKPSTSSELAEAIVKLLYMHTAIPNRTHGVFRWLHQILNGSKKKFTFARPTDVSKTKSDAEMRALVSILAQMEESGAFSTVISKPDDQFPGSAFDLYMAGYKGVGDDDVTNARPKTPEDYADAIFALFTEVSKMPKLTDPTTLVGNTDTTDTFHSALESHVEKLVEDTWHGVLCTTDVDSIVTRASTSVFYATGLKLRNTPGEMDTYLQQIVTSMRPQTDTALIQKVKEDGLLQAVCYITGDARTDAHKDGLERGDANHELRRQLLRDFVGSILEKNTQSLPKFLAMTRQLVANTSVDFKADEAVGADAIFSTAHATANDTTKLESLGKLVGTDYFVVKLDDMKVYNSSLPEFVVADTDTLGLDDAGRKEVFKLIAYNRLPREFFDRTGGRSMLKVDAYQQQIRDIERTTAGSSTGQQKKLELERLVSEVQEKHAFVEPLLKVRLDDVRAASLPELRTRLVCGVLFVDTSQLSFSDNCYRLFVHINGDEGAPAMKTKLLAFLKAQLKAQLAKNVAKNAIRTVVFGKDEWRSVLNPTTFTISTTAINVVGRNSISEPYTHEESTLFVHRWPEFEFIPAPYGLATPMFWYNPGTFLA